MHTVNAYQRVKSIVAGVLPVTLVMEAFDSIVHNDPAHNLDHVVKVILLGDELCQRKGVDYNTRKLVLAACLLHDLGCRYERSTHHQIGYGLVFEYLNRYGEGVFTEDEFVVVAKAVLEHRASYDQPRSGVISDMVALADRGEWDIDESVKRSLQYHLGKGATEEEAIQEVKVHFLDKFGFCGYAWKTYPKIGLVLYANEIAEFKYFAQDWTAVEQKARQCLSEM